MSDKGTQKMKDHLLVTTRNTGRVHSNIHTKQRGGGWREGWAPAPPTHQACPSRAPPARHAPRPSVTRHARPSRASPILHAQPSRPPVTPNRHAHRLPVTRHTHPSRPPVTPNHGLARPPCACDVRHAIPATPCLTHASRPRPPRSKSCPARGC